MAGGDGSAKGKSKGGGFRVVARRPPIKRVAFAKVTPQELAQLQKTRPSAGARSQTNAPDGREYEPLHQEIKTIEGAPLAEAGERFSPELIERLWKSRTGVEGLETALGKTKHFEELQKYLASPLHSAVFTKTKRQYEIMNAVRNLRLPRLLHVELQALLAAAPWAHEQAFISASITALLLARAGVGSASDIAQVWLACAIRDVGLTRVPVQILRSQKKLTASQFNEYLAHELYSGVILARSLGPSLAVRIATGHHRASPHNRWRPDVPGYSEAEFAALHTFLAVADAYTGMIGTRTFRSAAYSVRGALDTLISGARAGWHDVKAVALLVSLVRKDESVDNLRVSQKRRGDVPDENYFGI
ncbi:MAG: hypothetical protein AB1405_04070 [Bdellovibrionota bacterium]